MAPILKFHNYPSRLIFKNPKPSSNPWYNTVHQKAFCTYYIYTLILAHILTQTIPKYVYFHVHTNVCKIISRESSYYFI